MTSIYKKLIHAKIKKTVIEVELPYCRYKDVDGDVFIMIFSYEDDGQLIWGVAKLWGKSECEVSSHSFKKKEEAQHLAKDWCEDARQQEKALEEGPPKVVQPAQIEETPFEKLIRERKEQADKEEQ
ncbi:hypothetical protein [Priestia megaterium]|uniref:hypothetical protein n=1 Tax=Priestia megaterium TaxID=1404 RepID=UPI0011BB3C7C|nr:hypothetical protein [Priestia megaterium]QDZ80154.1 hypothetical protein D0440_12155 [Priestia megaterium]